MTYSAAMEAGPNGERHVRFTCSSPRPGKRLVMLAHSYGGATGGADQWFDGTAPYGLRLATQLAEAGFLCIGPDLNFGSFGADPAASRMYDEWQQAIALYGCASDQLVILGVSMGAMVAHHFARTYPGKVAGFYGIEPGLDLNGIYSTNALGLQTTIAAKWGVTAPAALPSGASPAANTAVWAGVPGRLAYSTADTVVTPASVTTFATATGHTTLQVSSSLQHGDALIGQVPPSDVAAFLASCGA